MERKEDSARHPQDPPQEEACQAPRQLAGIGLVLSPYEPEGTRLPSIDAIKHFITRIRQHLQCDVFREVMKMPILSAKCAQLAEENGPRRDIERDMDDLVFAPRAQLAQEGEVVFQVLQHVHQEHQIVARGVVPPDVGEPEMKPLILPAVGERQSARRNVISHQIAFAADSLLHQLQYFARAAADVADRPRLKTVSRHQLQHILRFPGRFVRVPEGIPPQVFAAGIELLRQSCSSQATEDAPRWAVAPHPATKRKSGPKELNEARPTK